MEERPGVKSSEFWLIIAYFATVIIAGTGYVTISDGQLGMLATLAFGYAGGRTLLKNTIAKQPSTQETKPNA